MPYFIVIENDQGLRVVEVREGSTAEQAAKAQLGVIIDPGPYHSYDDAYDALMQVPADERERAKLRD